MTKQVVAVMVMQQVEKGVLDLDQTASRYLPELEAEPASPTLRQLLQHRSGLPDPDETPADAEGVPSFYRNGPTGLAWCLQGRAAPPSEGWAYNNCDYIVLGEVLARVSGRDLPTLFAESIARPAGLESTAFAPVVSDKALADDLDRLARYGASGGLVGPLRDLLRFDRALLRGELVGAKARAEMWRGEPQLGFMGLGQWSFEAKLDGCPEAARIIERRGAIGRYQARNFILPDREMAVAVATDQASFDFGEIWMGSGFSYGLLSALACGS